MNEAVKEFLSPKEIERARKELHDSQFEYLKEIAEELWIRGILLNNVTIEDSRETMLGGLYKKAERTLKAPEPMTLETDYGVIEINKEKQRIGAIKSFEEKYIKMIDGEYYMWIGDENPDDL